MTSVIKDAYEILMFNDDDVFFCNVRLLLLLENFGRIYQLRNNALMMRIDAE